MGRGGHDHPPYVSEPLLLLDWARRHLHLINGHLIRAGLRWYDLSPYDFYSVVYSLAAEEIGSVANLKKWLADAVRESQGETIPGMPNVDYEAEQLGLMGLAGGFGQAQLRDDVNPGRQPAP